MLRKPIYCNCGCIYSNRQINFNNRFYIYCFRSLIYAFRSYIYSFRSFIYYDRYYNYINRRKKKKRNRKVSTEIQLNGQKGDRLTAVWQYGGFRAFLESSVFIQSFVYICDGSVLKVRHIAKLQNVMRDFKNDTPTMKLTDLIPYLKHADKWDDLLADLRIDTNCEEVLIYALDKLDIDSDILLIEVEKTEDNLEITLDGKNYVQLLPYSLAYELITIDFSNFKTDFDIAQRLIEYSINDA